MAKWGDFQSLIQLGAALNFGFAGYEYLVPQELRIVDDLWQRKIDEMLELKSDGAEKPLIDVADTQKFNSARIFVVNIEKFKSKINGINSIGSGVISIGILYWLSENAGYPVCNHNNLLIMIAISYGWFSINIILTFFLAIFVNFYMKHLVSGKKSI
jgi:hypothetical protein